MLRLNVIGAGKLGSTLARLCVMHGAAQVQGICNRSAESAERARQMIGAGQVFHDIEKMPAAELWMLSVSDDAINAVATQLLRAGVLRAGDVVFHCSGAKSSLELVMLETMGVLTASVHPVRSFALPEQVAADFHDTVCSVEGHPTALPILLPILTKIGAKTVLIDRSKKLLYHAGSVFASNYLVSLMDVALRAYEAAGIPSEIARAMAEPLAKKTLENVWKLGPAEALTGPLVRGDQATVQSQRQAVYQWDLQAGQLYDSFIDNCQRLIAERQKSD